MAKRLSWNQLVRRAVHADSRSIYALARDSGLGIGPMQRFAAGEHGLTLNSAEKLCRVLGIELRPAAQKRGRR